MWSLQMIDHLVHHVEVLALKGDSCRLKDLGRTPTTIIGTQDKLWPPMRCPLSAVARGSFSAVIDVINASSTTT